MTAILQFPPRHLPGLEAEYAETLRRAESDDFDFTCDHCRASLWLTSLVAKLHQGAAGEEFRTTLEQMVEPLARPDDRPTRDSRGPGIRRTPS